MISGPQLVFRGVVREDLETWFYEEATKIAKTVVRVYEEGLREDEEPFDLGEEMRVTLRRFIGEHLGKKATVIPVII